MLEFLFFVSNFKLIWIFKNKKDEMPAGETPCTIALYVRDDLVDSIQPGDRVEVTGIYRAIPLRVNPRARNCKSVYKTHIEVLHFRKKDAKRLYEGKTHAFDIKTLSYHLNRLANKKEAHFWRLFLLNEIIH